MNHRGNARSFSITSMVWTNSKSKPNQSPRNTLGGGFRVVQRIFGAFRSVRGRKAIFAPILKNQMRSPPETGKIETEKLTMCCTMQNNEGSAPSGNPAELFTMLLHIR